MPRNTSILILACIFLLYLPYISLGESFQGPQIEDRTFQTLVKGLSSSYPRLRNPPMMPSWPGYERWRNHMRKKVPGRPCRNCGTHSSPMSHRPMNSVEYQTNFIPIQNPYMSVDTTPKPTIPSSEKKKNIMETISSKPFSSYSPPKFHTTKPSRPTRVRPISNYQLSHPQAKQVTSKAPYMKPTTKPKVYIDAVKNKKAHHRFNFQIDHANGYSYVSQSLGSSKLT
eukprot:TRINITY_DN3422_c0_g1_i1.p1 TRINITY_DN3422_c0_g1~~TRINITY_DN3422_c0_g1_i1.p1  ORF type:complete len:227 (-),score=42.54 TRINITY_DN3422_c0_g1_i1:144-824(-)